MSISRRPGKRTGADVAVNASFNVGVPIAKTTTQVLDTLRLAKGMEGVFMFADDGPVLVAWVQRHRAHCIHDRIDAWRALS